MPHKAASALSVLLTASAFPAVAATVFVGPASDPDCDYHTIQDAVDAWAASASADFVDVYVANAQALSAIALAIPTPAASAGIGLHGEYPACRLGGATGMAMLDGAGNGGEPVIDIEGGIGGDARRFQVNLSSFDVAGGAHAGKGGGVRVRGNVTASLYQLDVHDNSADYGGGVSVEATAAGVPQLILVGNQRPMSVRDNHAAFDGGGYWCESASIYCDRYCLIEGNDAARNGGGVAQQACGTSIYAPPSSGPGDAHVGLRTNTAGADGGGAWASGGYFAIGGSAPLRPAPVVGNIAAGNGGGIFLSGLGSSSIGFRGVQFDGNSAGANGGALSADSGFLQMDAALSGDCAGDLGGCSRFSANHAGAAGGALALSGTARLQVWDMLFSGNDAPDSSVLRLASSSGFTLINAHMAGNHGAPELLRSSGAPVDLRYVTVADNGSDDDALIRFDAPGVFSASNSILYDFNGAGSGLVLDAPAGMTFHVNCVLVHDDGGIAGQSGVAGLLVADPQWDTSGLYPAGFYVPGPDSPAADACGVGTGNIPDLLGGARPQNLPKADAAGPYDMGAIERKPDVIFANGFDGS